MHLAYIVSEGTNNGPDGGQGNNRGPDAGQFVGSNLFIMYGGKMINEFGDG